jgi:hypothetical protein
MRFALVFGVLLIISILSLSTYSYLSLPDTDEWVQRLERLEKESSHQMGVLDLGERTMDFLDITWERANQAKRELGIPEQVFYKGNRDSFYTW